MKKILILYAKYGGGHLSAANSIQSYVEENYYSNTEVKCVDCVEYFSMFLSNVTTGAYKRMAKNTPNLWKKLYYGSRKGFISHVSNVANSVMAKKIYKLFKEFSPDVVISTHPFASQITSYLKKNKNINCVLATVLTDFVPHAQWLVGKDYCNYFFVSNEKMRESLINSYDISAKKVFTTGIPLAKTFSSALNDDDTYKKYGLDENKKTILFFGGGEFGLGQKRTVQVLQSLANHIDEYQIVAVSGRNKKMNNDFLKLSEKLKNNDLHVLKYTKDVPALMHISSLVVTKPGGLTSSESLASNLPILIINPIPGQEEENAEFLESSGAAIWLKKDDNIDTVVDSILCDGATLETLRKKSKLIAKPNSTRDICMTLLGDLG